ncbi:hypothetical protein ACTHRK_10550 [Dietzia cercidiphylli]|uniref:hypothetical protein n=1 Tax=Dietzia cercidiphylli TaxID=498199 RepID=UPI003F7D9C98
MITNFRETYTLGPEVFREALEVIERSGAAELIDEYRAEARGAGGRPPTGPIYTIKAVLVAALTLLMLQRTPSEKGLLEALANFSDSQLNAVGMGGQDVMGACKEHSARAYKSFQIWLTRALLPLDSGPDLPARRITNGQHRRQLASRTAAQREASSDALERSRHVMNRIVAGSVLEQSPAGCVGDVVTDETIIRLAGTSRGLGIKDDKTRGAAYVGNFHQQDRKTTDSSGATIIQTHKAGFSVGLTVLTRIGRRDALHSVVPVITAIDVHSANGADLEGLAQTIRFQEINGLDCRRGGRGRWPLLTADMGYVTLNGFDRLMLTQKIAHVSRYPRHWGRILPAANPAGVPADRQLPGPIQVEGTFFCPTAEPMLRTRLVRKTEELLKDGEFRSHDARLAAVLPLMMGTNSRPKLARPTRGRVKIGAPEPEKVVKQEFVCPAVQGRVRCPLKPASMDTTNVEAPLVEPTWAASQYTVCEKSSATVTFTAEQFKRAQFDLVPGSWEHALYFEAARALTEQRFSILKSQHVNGFHDMTWTARREPMIKILIALTVAVANWRVQKTASERAHLSRVESIDIRMRQLRSDLGHAPTRTPPRT